MNSQMRPTALTRLTAWSRVADRTAGAAGSGRTRFLRRMTMVVLAAIVAPLLAVLVAVPASADDDAENYSLYQLASNASSYFSEKSAPGEEGVDENWDATLISPSSGGSMLGYADPEFSLGNITGWLFSSISGSSQTVLYETFAPAEGADSSPYSGMLDYGHFGAANLDLGLDSMSSSSNPLTTIFNALGGGIMSILYMLAIVVSMLFWLIIQLLKALNPFAWFYQAVSAINPTFAEGMINGGDGVPVPLQGLSNFISNWYGILVNMSWTILVPIFLAVMLMGMLLFKKMDKGSALRKFLTRIIFIGVGLPLLGSMYTGVLDKFDDDLMGASAGPTKVVLSTYVDFDSWMMNNRLAVPDAANISWAGDQASSQSAMAVRTTALAINVASNPDVWGDITVGTPNGSATDAWREGTVNMSNDTSGSSAESVLATFNLLLKHMGNKQVLASDFESGIKTTLTNSDVTEKDWFVDDYKDSEDFGQGGIVEPIDHPVISVRNGLQSSNPGGNSTTFTSTGTANCGFTVTEGDSADPADCNLAPLASYNYLNTSFGPDSLTMYSSTNVASGFSRENHLSVSQVGTGPAKFMYWSNSAVILGSMVLLGFWYAIGMLAGSLKRIFGLVAAVPFATLGAVASIAKVIVYSVALILEVLVTLFIYQFVSELITSIPDVIAGPISSWMSPTRNVTGPGGEVVTIPGGLFGSATLGGIVVIVATLVSTLIIIGVTFALLRVRKVVLQAMDETFTKIVDKFLDTNTAPASGGKGGGLAPALASGVGAGAGMALGNKLGRSGDSNAANVARGGSNGGGGGGGRGSAPTSNAGGNNGESSSQMAGGGATALLEAGQSRPGGGGPDDANGGLPGGSSSDGDGPSGNGGGGGGRGLLSGGGGDLADGSGPSRGSSSASGQTDGGADGGEIVDGGGPLQLTSGGPGSTASDKEIAQTVANQGGLSNLGFDSSRGGAGEAQRTNLGGNNSSDEGGSGAGTGAVVPGSANQSGSRKAGGRQDKAGASKPTSFGSGAETRPASGPGGTGTGSSAGSKTSTKAAGSAALSGPSGPAGSTTSRTAPATRSTRAQQTVPTAGSTGSASQRQTTAPRSSSAPRSTQPTPAGASTTATHSPTRTSPQVAPARTSTRGAVPAAPAPSPGSAPRANSGRSSTPVVTETPAARPTRPTSLQQPGPSTPIVTVPRAKRSQPRRPS